MDYVLENDDDDDDLSVSSHQSEKTKSQGSSHLLAIPSAFVITPSLNASVQLDLVGSLSEVGFREMHTGLNVSVPSRTPADPGSEISSHRPTSIRNAKTDLSARMSSYVSLFVISFSSVSCFQRFLSYLHFLLLFVSLFLKRKGWTRFPFLSLDSLFYFDEVIEFHFFFFPTILPVSVMSSIRIFCLFSPKRDSGDEVAWDVCDT